VQINTLHQTWHIILNPNALLHQSSRFWKDIEDKLREVQINYRHHVTPTVADAKKTIINLCHRGERHFIVVGGDGSLNIFVNAVMEARINSSEVFATLIPLGTGNDWSRLHGYSDRYLDALDSLVKGNFMPHDVGLVETVINDQVVDARYFVNIAGFGFDGAVISNVNKKTSKYFPKQLYLINLLKTLVTYHPQLVTLTSNDFTIAKNVFTIAVGIGKYNGNGMCQCPDAIPDDGLFDVVIIEKVPFLKVLFHIRNLFKGTHIKKMKEVSTYRTKSLNIMIEPFILGEVEGEMLTAGNYRIRCLESAIHFMKI